MSATPDHTSVEYSVVDPAQDLRHTKMIIWSPHVDQLLPNQTKTFFESYKQYIEVRAWNYSQQIIGTPWEKDPFFGDHALVQKHLDTSATYADIVRLLLLHNYGGEPLP